MVIAAISFGTAFYLKDKMFALDFVPRKEWRIQDKIINSNHSDGGKKKS